MPEICYYSNMRICNVEGCSNEVGPRTKHVYCRKHQYHFERYGDPLHYIYNCTPQTCKADGCTQRAVAHGYCGKHNMRVKRHSDANTILHFPTKSRSINKMECHSYSAMLIRCYNKKHSQYKDYGGRGITVCDRWRGVGGFKNFLEDMGERPEDCTLDRIDVNDNYCPENCRWASHKEQMNNRRNSRKLDYNGENHTVAEWADKVRLSAALLYNRLHHGWSAEKALTTPVRKIGGS